MVPTPYTSMLILDVSAGNSPHFWKVAKLIAPDKDSVKVLYQFIFITFVYNNILCPSFKITLKMTGPCHWNASMT